MKTTTTKPAGKQWWNEVDPAAAQRYATFCNGFAGVVSAAGGVSQSNANVFESTIVFTDQNACQAFAAACRSNSDWASRQAYLTSNGFTYTFQFS